MSIKISYAQAILDRNPVYYDDWDDRLEKRDTKPFTDKVNHIILKRDINDEIAFGIPDHMRGCLDYIFKHGASKYIVQLCDKDWVPIQNILTQKYEYWNDNESIVTDDNNRIISYRKHDLFGGGEIIDGQCKIGRDKKTNKMYFTYTFRKNKFGKRKFRVVNQNPILPSNVFAINVNNQSTYFFMDGIIGSCTYQDIQYTGDSDYENINWHKYTTRSIKIGEIHGESIKFILNGVEKEYIFDVMRGSTLENNARHTYDKVTDRASIFNIYPDSIWNVSAVVGRVSTETPYVTAQAGLKTRNQLRELFTRKKDELLYATNEKDTAGVDAKKTELSTLLTNLAYYDNDAFKFKQDMHYANVFEDLYDLIKPILGDEYMHKDHLVRDILQNARLMDANDFKKYMLKLSSPRLFKEYISDHPDKKLFKQYNSQRDYSAVIKKVIEASQTLKRPEYPDE